MSNAIFALEKIGGRPHNWNDGFQHFQLQTTQCGQ